MQIRTVPPEDALPHPPQHRVRVAALALQLSRLHAPSLPGHGDALPGASPTGCAPGSPLTPRRAVWSPRASLSSRVSAGGPSCSLDRGVYGLRQVQTLAGRGPFSLRSPRVSLLQGVAPQPPAGLRTDLRGVSVSWAMPRVATPSSSPTVSSPTLSPAGAHSASDVAVCSFCPYKSDVGAPFIVLVPADVFGSPRLSEHTNAVTASAVTASAPALRPGRLRGTGSPVGGHTSLPCLVGNVLERRHL